MTPYDCPLYIHAKEQPFDLFIDGKESFTYRDFEGYVQEISKEIEHFDSGSTLATRSDHLVFNVALLIAAARRKLIVFILSHRLTDEQIQERLTESQTAHYFKEPIPYNSTALALSAPPEISPAAPLTLLLTSGTSSRPKICVHSFQNHFEAAYASNQVLPFTRGDRWLLNMPLSHVSGLSLIFRALLAKATLVLPSESVEKDLETQNITHFSCVNTQLKRALKYPELLKTLKVILLGGGRALPALVGEAQKHNLPLYKTYGLTELSSQVATSKTPFEQPSFLPHINFKFDSAGQILLQGPSLFLGYLVDQKIQPSVDLEGYFETKDTGILEHHKLTVLSRMDNLFISGGENIQPEEIEAVLLKYPGITEALVVPKKHPEYDLQPIAFIQVKETFDATHLLSFLGQKLPKFKIPKKFLPLKYEGLKPSRRDFQAL